MARESAQIGANYEKVILGVSNDSALEPRMLRVDPITNRLLVDALLDLGADVIDLTTRDALAVGIVDGNGDQITSFGGGIQYTEGDTDATITGTALMWEDAGNTLTPISASKPLPVSATLDATGLATSAKQDTIISYLDGVETLLGTIDADTGGIATSTASIDSKVPALGQALAAASIPVVLPAAQITTLTPPAAITGFATSAKQDTIIGHLDGVEGLLTTIDANTGSIDTKLSTTNTSLTTIAGYLDGVEGLLGGTLTVDSELPAAAALADNTADPTTVIVGVLPMFRDGSDGNWDRARSLNATLNTAAAGSGIQGVGLIAQYDDTSPTTITENQFGNLRMTSNRNLHTTIRDAAGNERGLNVGANGELGVVQKAATATLSNVSGSASSVTLLASNSSRYGAQIVNDSSAVLYIKFGSTASTSSYTVSLAGASSPPFSYYEVPAGYTGIITGIWASATGNARVTEITP